jgi:hypothetical protein
MQEEILNIEYHTKRLVVKALNTCGTHEAAAARLGICTRTVFRLKRIYGIKKVNGQFTIIQKTVNERKKLHLGRGSHCLHGQN